MIQPVLEYYVEASPGLKAFLFFLLWVALWLPIAIPLSIILQWNPFRHRTTPAQKLFLLVSLYPIAPLLLWGLARVEGKSLADYGLPWNGEVGQSLLLGLLLGGGGLAIAFAVQLSWQWLQVPPPSLAGSASESIYAHEGNSETIPIPFLVRTLCATFAIGIGVSLPEELIFRGFLLDQFQEYASPGLAAAIASLIFAVLHLVWEGRENLPSLPGLWLMGMVLTLARWVDGGNLGLAWGLHAGWVWILASCDSLHFIKPTDRVPAWLTGWQGNPLAGLVGVLFLGITGVGIWSLGRFF